MCQKRASKYFCQGAIPRRRRMKSVGADVLWMPCHRPITLEIDKDGLVPVDSVGDRLIPRPYECLLY